MSHTKILWLLPLALLCACNNAKYNGVTENAPTSSKEAAYLNTADSVSFATDISSLTSPSRKIIRTAFFRCRVQNVYNAASQLEDMVKATGGIVQESKIETTTSDQRTINYKPDSLKQVQVYQSTALLTLRVPVAMLDSVIKAVPNMAAFIEERSLKQDDVTLRYLSNALKNEPGTTDYTHHALKNAKKTNEVLNVGEYDANKKEQTVNRRVENLQLLEDVNYATIRITFFQPQQVDAHVIVNADYYTRPPFGTQFFSAIGEGWELLKNFFLTLVRIWPYLFLTSVGIIALKNLRRKRWIFARRKV